MTQSTSWEANRFSASQEIPRTLWNPKVHYLRQCPPSVPILSQIDPVHAPHPTSWRSILILSFHLRLDLPSGLIKFHFALKLGVTFKSNESEIIWASESDARWTKTALDYATRVILYVSVLRKTNNVHRCALCRQHLTQFTEFITLSLFMELCHYIPFQ